MLHFVVETGVETVGGRPAAGGKSSSAAYLGGFAFDSAAGEADAERAALARAVAFHFDRAAVVGDDAMADRKP